MRVARLIIGALHTFIRRWMFRTQWQNRSQGRSVGDFSECWCTTFDVVHSIVSRGWLWGGVGQGRLRPSSWLIHDSRSSLYAFYFYICFYRIIDCLKIENILNLLYFFFESFLFFLRLMLYCNAFYNYVLFYNISAFLFII